MHTREPIAVTGLSTLLPGCADVGAAWRAIADGRDLLGEVPSTAWRLDEHYDPDPGARDKTYARRGGFLSAVDFDPLAFGVSPVVARATDSAQLLALMCAKRALDDATGGRLGEGTGGAAPPASGFDRERASVILGVTVTQQAVAPMVSRLQRPVWAEALAEHGLPPAEVDAICDRIASRYPEWQESTFPGLLANVVAGRIAHRFDLHGTSCVTDAACASSLAAVSMAAHELWAGTSDSVLTGGVDTLNDVFMYLCFSKTPALSPTGDARPFAAGADGTSLGEGLAMFVLERLSDAERLGRRVYAVLRGVGSSSDGRSSAVYAPRADGQARAIRRAYDRTGYDLGSVGLIEAHGTGTRAGDAAEIAGLVEATPAGAGPIALGSVKSQVGHTKGAAGAVGLLKAVLAVRHGVVPPTVKVDAPSPALDGTPFWLPREARPWVGAIRRAGVSSFGFGGTNFHVAVEAYAGPLLARRVDDRPAVLVALSAVDPGALLRALDGVRDAADADGTLATFDREAPERITVVASPDAVRDAVAVARERVARGEVGARDGVAYGRGPGRELELVVAGAAGAAVDAGADLAMAFDEALAVWDAVAAVELDGERLPDVVFPRSSFDPSTQLLAESRLEDRRWARAASAAVVAAQRAVLARLGVGEPEPDPAGAVVQAFASEVGDPDVGAACRSVEAAGRVPLVLGPAGDAGAAAGAGIAVDRAGVHGVVALLEALGAVTAAGASVRLASLWDGVATRVRPEAPRMALRIAGTTPAARRTTTPRRARPARLPAVRAPHVRPPHARPADGPTRAPLDLVRAAAWWRRQARPSELAIDLHTALVARFVGDVFCADPSVLDALRGRAVVFVANHQVAVESPLFVTVTSALTGVPVRAIGKAEHAGTWIGRLAAEVTGDASSPLVFFDRSRPASFLELATSLAADLRAARSSVLVHVEGTRATSCRAPVTRLAAAVLQMALAAGAAVVPVRFARGLPVAELAERLDFPVGYGRQDVWLGRPIEPAELGSLPLAEGKERVLDAMRALGPARGHLGPPALETPAPPDPSFAAEVASWRPHAVADPHAVMLAALAASPHLRPATRRLLDDVRAGRPVAEPLLAWLTTRGANPCPTNEASTTPSAHP